jgi:Fe-Mn family superoxide dismutase
VDWRNRRRYDDIPAEARPVYHPAASGTTRADAPCDGSWRRKHMNRRDTLKLLAGATAFAVGGGLIGRGPVLAQAKPFTLPPLGYANEALEPHIDARTMQIHHDVHHAAYVNNANGLVDKWPDLATKPIEDILSNLAAAPEAVRTGVRNNVGGHWNHAFFWELMTPGGAKEPAGDLKSAIDAAFGDLAKMKAAVKAAGLGRFGSGWAWLGIGKDKKLAVFSTANQDTPHMEGSKAVLGIDVWEHAYYLKHQSKRGDYIDAWWNVVNWDKAAANFKKARA